MPAEGKSHMKFVKQSKAVLMRCGSNNFFFYFVEIKPTRFIQKYLRHLEKKLFKLSDGVGRTG